MLIHCPDCPFMLWGRECALTGLRGKDITSCPHREFEKYLQKAKAAPDGAALAQGHTNPSGAAELPHHLPLGKGGF